MIARTRRPSAATHDDGVAMITVIGIMMVVTILAIGSYTLARQALDNARKTRAETSAFRVAAAGLDSALSSFDPSNTSYPDVVTTDGTATITVTKTDGDAGEYEIVSRGVAPDGGVETVTQKFYFFNLWEMNFAGTGSQSLMSGSSGMNGSSNIYGPFYVKGNLSLDANFTVRDGPLFVKEGKLATTSSASSIGLPGKSVRIYCDGTTDLTKGSLYFEGPFLSVPEIELPALTAEQMEGHATLSQSQSSDGVMSRTAEGVETPPNRESGRAANYKFFGAASGVPSPLGSGTTTLVLGTPAAKNNNRAIGSFGSWGSVDTTGQVIPAGGAAPYPNDYRNRWDDFAYWDNPTGIIPGGWDVMFISGTVFVDGPLVIDDNVMYIGNGTIVANGPVTLNGKIRPYSYSTASITVNKVGEDKKWALGIVTPSSLTMNGWGSNSGVDPVRNNAFDYAGAFYTDSTLTITNTNTSVRGSILSKKMDILKPNGDIVTNPLLPTYLPDSLPGGDAGVITKGMWSRT